MCTAGCWDVLLHESDAPSSMSAIRTCPEKKPMLNRVPDGIAWPSITMADPLVSPLHAAHAGLPRLLIQAGTSELLAPDAGLLAASAEAARVDVTYTRWPRMWHDFPLYAGVLAAADSAVAQAAWFIGLGFPKG